MKSQLEEIKELRERDTRINTFPILSLPNISCETDIGSALASLPELHPLDGLLFYHRDGQYTKGRTPLVTWLKPFMLPEVLGIFIPPPFDEKPDGYIDYKVYIRNSKVRKRKEDSSGQVSQLFFHDAIII